MFWFQLYRFRRNDHAITFDLVRRADDAGALVLVPTIDSAGKSKRPRDIRRRQGAVQDRSQDVLPDRDVAAVGDGVVQDRQLRTENIVPYTKGHATRDNTARTMRVLAPAATPSTSWRGCATAGRGPFVVKGVLHPADAERLVSLGVDGMIVSNHGGRHFDGAPASVDILPSIVAAVNSARR